MSTTAATSIAAAAATAAAGVAAKRRSSSHPNPRHRPSTAFRDLDAIADAEADARITLPFVGVDSTPLPPHCEDDLATISFAAAPSAYAECDTLSHYDRAGWTPQSDLIVSVITWNMAAREPREEEVATLVKPNSHVIIVATQENGPYLGLRGVHEKWENMIARGCLMGRYIMVASRSLWATHVAIFARARDVASRIGFVHSDVVKTGFLSNQLGNKGGVGIAFTINLRPGVMEQYPNTPAVMASMRLPTAAPTPVVVALDHKTSLHPTSSAARMRVVTAIQSVTDETAEVSRGWSDLRVTDVSSPTELRRGKHSAFVMPSIAHVAETSDSDSEKSQTIGEHPRKKKRHTSSSPPPRGGAQREQSMVSRAAATNRPSADEEEVVTPPTREAVQPPGDGESPRDVATSPHPSDAAPRELKILVVGAHLTAHQGRAAKRNDDYNRIVRELKVGSLGPYEHYYRRRMWGDLRATEAASALRDVSREFDVCVVCGDLNYRLHGTNAAVAHIVERLDWRSVLSENDELLREMRSGRVFAGFVESPLTFRPTYKYNIVDDDSGRTREGGRGAVSTPPHAPLLPRGGSSSGLPRRSGTPLRRSSSTASLTPRGRWRPPSSSPTRGGVDARAALTYDPRRIPSYTDRILLRVRALPRISRSIGGEGGMGMGGNEGLEDSLQNIPEPHVQWMVYTDVPSVRTSDHLPVVAMLRLKTKHVIEAIDPAGLLAAVVAPDRAVDTCC